jgi:hypothetical protein
MDQQQDRPNCQQVMDKIVEILKENRCSLHVEAVLRTQGVDFRIMVVPLVPLPSE